MMSVLSALIDKDIITVLTKTVVDWRMGNIFNFQHFNLLPSSH